MPTVEQNARGWGLDYDWEQQGEEWSRKWGDSRAQWFGSILPRIHAFVPAGTILEIAPGYGRWTEYLRRYCSHLIVVDLCASCIDVCRERFGEDGRIKYHVNDGKSLAMVEDDSVDFVFSFDSLVHAEEEVIDIYLQQLARKLRPDGVGYIHHSNIGEYELLHRSQHWPLLCQKALRKMGVLDPIQWRAFSMTAAVFERCCERAGLQCIGQEQVNWGSRRRIDCFSTFVRKGSKWARPNTVTRNGRFMTEAKLVRRWSRMCFAGAASGVRVGVHGARVPAPHEAKNFSSAPDHREEPQAH